MLTLRSKQEEHVKHTQDKLINFQLQELIAELQPKVVHSYLPMPGEVDISDLITNLLRRGIKVVCPQSLPKRQMKHLALNSLQELEEGIFGTKHPTGKSYYEGNYDLIIVPGLAFDKQRNRLGYGAGYYDTFLKQQEKAYKVGVAYTFQVLDQIPVEGHDVRMDRIIY